MHTFGGSRSAPGHREGSLLDTFSPGSRACPPLGPGPPPALGTGSAPVLVIPADASEEARAFAGAMGCQVHFLRALPSRSHVSSSPAACSTAASSVRLKPSLTFFLALQNQEVRGPNTLFLLSSDGLIKPLVQLTQYEETKPIFKKLYTSHTF